jgi:uncharacterized protein Usg
MSHLYLQLRGLRLATAEILYHLPDYPQLLQSYIWQEYDLAPDFPVLHRFLDFWEKNLEGRLHSVKIMCASHLSTQDLQHIRHAFQVH